MTPTQLLKHFDRLSEAPNAIPRLRRFILDLAVRGKLVEQDPNDEPAVELLKRNSVWRTNAIQRKQIREPRKTLKNIGYDETLYTIPSGWAWARLGEIIYIQSGDGLTATNMKNGDIPVFGGNGINGYHNESNVEEPTIVIGRVGYYCGSIHVTPNKAWVTDNAFITRFCQQAISMNFLVLLLNGTNLKENENATAQPVISGSKIYPIVIGLPPLAEQHCIVAKVDELMALCDQLEATKAEREQSRDRLLAANLHHLNQPTDDEEAFREHVRFTFNHLPRITTRPAHIKQLRQTILNLAVRGKLVPQDPNDEPAAELLKRIQAEKARLVKEGKIKSEKVVQNFAFKPTISALLPQGWLWTKLQYVCTSVTDGDHLAPPKSETGIPFLVIGNVKSQIIDFVGCRHVPESYYNKLDTIRRPSKGDILYTLVGSYGIPVIVRDTSPFCVQRHIGILRPSKNLNLDFLARILASELVFKQATECATGIAQKTVPLAGLRAIRIPLPPFAEQHRIVAKVDELMALCDQLETQLTTNEADSRRLLGAVLHEALMPALDKVA